MHCMETKDFKVCLVTQCTYSSLVTVVKIFKSFDLLDVVGPLII